MEINLNKKTIKWGLIGLGAVIAVTLSLLPKPHHNTMTSTPTAPATTTTTAITTTNTETSLAKSVQPPQSSQNTIKLINTDQSVSKLIGSHFVTVAIKSTPVQALDGQYLGQLSQIMITNPKNKTVPGIWVVPRKFANNLLIVSIKSNEVSNLQQDLAKKWFLVHKS